MRRIDFENNAIERCKENGNGIYFIYSDSLNGDSAVVIVVKDGEKIFHAHPSYYSEIVSTIKNEMKMYPTFELFGLSKGYFTYSSNIDSAMFYVKALRNYRLNPTIINY